MADRRTTRAIQRTENLSGLWTPAGDLHCLVISDLWYAITDNKKNNAERISVLPTILVTYKEEAYISIPTAPNNDKTHASDILYTNCI